MENMHTINMHKEFSLWRRTSSLQLMGQTGSLGNSSEQLQHFAISIFFLILNKESNRCVFFAMAASRWSQSVKSAAQIALETGTKQGHGFGREGRRENI